MIHDETNAFGIHMEYFESNGFCRNGVIELPENEFWTSPTLEHVQGHDKNKQKLFDIPRAMVRKIKKALFYKLLEMKLFHPFGVLQAKLAFQIGDKLKLTSIQISKSHSYEKAEEI